MQIAIVGGGPGGLTLARILSVHGVTADVFEADAHEMARPQGGSLDLHEDSGLIALRRAGLYDDFKRLARYEDQGMRLLDPSGARIWDEGSQGENYDRPEIDRTHLRAMLITSLPKETIKWGTKVMRVEDGRVVTDKGTFGPYDLVVGADGIWSKVRPLLSDEKPAYCGVAFVELQHDDMDAKHPEIVELVGRGKMFALGSNKTIITQRSANAHYRTYLAFRQPEGWVEKTFDFSSPSKARASLLGYLQDFAPELRAIVETTNDVIVPRALYALPTGFSWKHRPGVTLLGDAAHVMSPFAGEGVNIAMFDAAELADAIVSGKPIAEYESKMFERAALSADASMKGLDMFVSTDAAKNAVAWMNQMMAG